MITVLLLPSIFRDTVISADKIWIDGLIMCLPFNIGDTKKIVKMYIQCIIAIRN